MHPKKFRVQIFAYQMHADFHITCIESPIDIENAIVDKLGKKDIIGKKDKTTGRIPLGFLQNPKNRPDKRDDSFDNECQVTLFGSPANSVQAYKAMQAATYQEKGYEEVCRKSELRVHRKGDGNAQDVGKQRNATR